MKNIMPIFALSFLSLLISSPSYAVYIGEGLYEAKFKKSDRLIGESVKAYLYRKAFEACSEEKLGFKVVELKTVGKPEITFRCDGIMDKKLASELKVRRELSSDQAEVEAATSNDEVDGDFASTENSGSLPADKTNYVNAMIGVGWELSGEEKDSFFTYSGRFGGDVYAGKEGSVALGLFFGRRATETTAIGTATLKSSTTLVMAEALGRKIGGSGLYAGARLGLAFYYLQLKSPSYSADDTATSFAFGPVVGYEIPLAEKFKPNLELSFVHVGSGSLSAPGIGDVPYDSTSALLLQGGFMFEFTK